jgi:F-type H+-transporting ATPase subunit epsilon
MAELHFELVTPERLVRSDDVHMVVVPGVEGDFGVMAGHAPVMTVLKDHRSCGVGRGLTVR